MTQAEMRIANMKHLSDAELTKRALTEDHTSAYRSNHYISSPTNLYREEIQRRQAVAATELVAA